MNQEPDRQPEERTRSLSDFYLEVSGLSFSNSAEGRRRIKEFVGERHLYTGPVNIWYNLTAETGRLQLSAERGLIISEGLAEHPNNVDLICEVLQEAYNTSKNMAQAKETWQKLSSLEEAKFFWRYWVYGAIYHAKMLRDRETALSLLESGLHHVNSEHINDIVRAYRQVLIDAPPNSDIKNREEREAVESEVFTKLEEIYKWAISLGVENSYDLAVDLAKLYQERAESEFLYPDQEQILVERSLQCLELAERRYTANSNHPIWNIYLSKARLYIGLRKYAEAVKIFRILPESIVSNDPSIEVQYKYSAQMSGEQIDDLSVVDLIKKRGREFFRELFELAATDENIKQALIAFAKSNDPSILNGEPKVEIGSIVDLIRSDDKAFFQELFAVAASNESIKQILIGLTNQLS